MEQLSRLYQLSWQQRKVLLYACLLLNGIRLALWLLPFGQVRILLERGAAIERSHQSPATVSVGFIVRAVKAASRYTPGGAMCLVRALTTQSLLGRYGYPHELRIGVARNAANGLEAHAWIEYKGQVIIGELNRLNDFQPLVAADTRS